VLGDEDFRHQARAIQVFSYCIRLAPLAALVVSFSMCLLFIAS